MSKILNKYTNGNCEITIESDGTRTIEFPDNEGIQLVYPLNIDIRVSTQCSFGLNPKTNKAICSFCHESAVTDGKDCDYNTLLDKLRELPKGIELAIGCNKVTQELIGFLYNCKDLGFICNLTCNQGHLNRDAAHILYLIKEGLVKGLGISYRSFSNNFNKMIISYPNTVFHVIAGIDNVDEVINLKSKGVNKILVLGEKNFGLNLGKVDLESQSHKDWYNKLEVILRTFNVVSFDNLALEQLNVRRFLSDDDWNTFYQGEHSFYINAVDQYFAPSSRSNDKTDFNNLSIKDYFKTIDK